MLSKQNFPRRLDQRLHFRRRANRDPQIIFHFREIEPADEDFLLAQLALPFVRGEARRLDEDEIRPARKNPETELRQFAAQPLARGDDLFEIRAVKLQIAQRRFRRDLAEAVHVVAVADFVQRGDEFRVPDEIADALEHSEYALENVRATMTCGYFSASFSAFSFAKST